MSLACVLSLRAEELTNGNPIHLAVVCQRIVLANGYEAGLRCHSQHIWDVHFDLFSLLDYHLISDSDQCVLKSLEIERTS